jgi:indolepyruvate ferredoxin oxidoreductase
MNKTAYNWGRMAAHDIDVVRNAANGVPTKVTATLADPLDDEAISRTLDEEIARRVAFLTDYQNAAYANRYKALVDRTRAAEQQRSPGFETLAEAVARYAFKLMAYKDEYEVARLYTSGEFERRIKDTFDGDYKLHFNLAPPMFAKKNEDGTLRKAEYGPWVFSAFRLLAKLRGLRGSALDVFGYTAERRMERRLVADYAKIVDELLAGLAPGNVALAVDIASVPEHIRGYGHVKERHYAAAMKRQDDLLAAWRSPAASRAVA